MSSQPEACHFLSEALPDNEVRLSWSYGSNPDPDTWDALDFWIVPKDREKEAVERILTGTVNTGLAQK